MFLQVPAIDHLSSDFVVHGHWSRIMNKLQIIEKAFSTFLPDVQ